MLITKKDILKKYEEKNRLWQGIPSIEVTDNGRIFSAFYSGGTEEAAGNYILVYTSDDEKKFSLTAVITPCEGERCFDPSLWIDPLNRLWIIWSNAPSDLVCAIICNEPDNEKLVFSDEKVIGKGVMMNKPTILSSGEWLFPIAVWKSDVATGGFIHKIDMQSGSYVYRSIDHGKNFKPYGYADVPKRSFDEHMIIELTDGTLQMFVRTSYGIGTSFSYDGGKTWTKGVDSTLGGPCSRFCIRRLKSGRIILINHYKFKGRNNLTAMLSEDDGKTFPYKLLIDGRDSVSYPDLKEAEDGFIYIVYDRERGAFLKNIDAVLSCAREILYAKISEQDIINGKISNESSLQNIISKLGAYEGDLKNPYKETDKMSDSELASKLIVNGKNSIDDLFDLCPVNCINLKNIKFKEIDYLITAFKEGNHSDIVMLEKIIKIVRNASKEIDVPPIIDKVIDYVKKHFTQNFSVAELAKIYSCSIFYLCHEFKKTTGITVVDYKNGLRLMQAKAMLYHTNKSVVDIALECGYSNESYFCEIFAREEGISPISYRNIISRNKKQ